MEGKATKDWFENWFDSNYYHLLYKDRNDEEAEFFISNLLKYLAPQPNSTFLDLACGKGRHSIHLNKLGYDVTGIDLSANSINYAKQFEKNSLHFELRDMREMYKTEAFDYVLNLFTSFGYFEDDLDNLNALISVKNSLKRGGTLVVDFFNAEKIVANAIPHEKVMRGNIQYDLYRKVEDGKIIKTIEVNDNGNLHSFQERVQLLDLDRFTELFRQARFQITDIFGSYNLDEFDEQTSERLILIAVKM
ncbi:MAG: class I SAM-dependent methyltransferase [Bacteroidia bacterium]